MTSQITSLLAKFKSLTGMEPNIRVHERAAWEFIQIYGDQSEANLELVVKHIQHQNRKGDFKLSLRIDKILNDMERTDGILAEARALHRNRRPAPSPREQVLQAFRPVMGENTTSTATKSIKDVMKAIQ